MNKNKRKSNAFMLLASGFGVLILQDAGAQGVDFAGSIRAGVSDTDNVFLQAAPNETEETIYSVSPSFALDYTNERINTLVRYSFDWYRYSDADSTRRYHRYDAQLTGELVDDVLLLEVGGARSQSLKDPDFVIPSGSLPLTNNFVDRDEVYVEPSFEKTLGRSVTVSASYRYTDVSYDESDFEPDESVQKNSTERGSFKIENYRRQQGLSWAAAYDWRQSDYDESLSWEYRKATGELGYWANGKTRLFVSGGRESKLDDLNDRSLESDFWEGGFAYRSGDKLSAEFAAGERDYGFSWRGQLDLAFRRGQLAFNYSERQSTDGLYRYDRGNLVDPEEPDDLLTQPGNADRHLQKRGQARLSLDFRRTAVAIVAFDETRTSRFSSDGDPLPDQSQTGAAVSASWQLGARTGLTAATSFTNRETGIGEQDNVSASLGINYRLGSSINLALVYRYSEQDPEDSAADRDYVANVVSFFVTYSF